MYRFVWTLLTVLIVPFQAFPDASNSVESATVEQVHQAAGLTGLEFTDQEAEQLRRRVDRYRDNYQSLRDVHIPNRLSPAYYFDPRPADFKMKTQYLQPVWSRVSKTSLNQNDQDFAFYSIRELSELIRTRKITSTELTRYYINRLKKYDQQLNCVVTFTEELALQRAQQADKAIAAGKYRGLLHGIPYGAKDLLAVKNYPTTWGVEIYKDRQIDKNAAVIQKLEEAGAVLVAKLSLGELAMGDVWFGGKTRNPWNIEQGSSGSSAGSAAAVVAGLVPFAIGSETLGSIVSPCYRCGATGLRPTFGRVSRAGAMTLSWTMDKLGPICRSVEDTAIVFNAIHGADPRDPSSITAPFNYTPNINVNDIRVGYYAAKMEEDYDNKQNDLETLNVLKKLGMTLVPIQEPTAPIQPLSIILHAETAAAFDELTRSNQDDELLQQHRGAWPNIFRSSRFIPAVEYIQANRIRSLLIEQMHAIMKKVDVIAAPPYHGNNLLLTNLTGHPCVVVPNGFDEEGNPAAITFIGHLYDEARLLAIAKAYQDAAGYHQRHPQLD